MKTIFFIVRNIALFIAIVSCTNGKEKTIVVNNDRSSTINRYKNYTDTVPYLQINILSDGTVKDTFRINQEGQLDGWQFNNDTILKRYTRVQYKNGEIHGKCIITKNDSTRYVQHYYNNLEYGIERQYTKDNFLFTELVLVNDTVVYVVFNEKFSKGDTLTRYSILNNNKEEKLIYTYSGFSKKLIKYNGEYNNVYLGTLSYDCKGKVIDSNESYLTSTISNDTLENGDSFTINIKGYFGNLEKNGTRLKIELGNLNTNGQIDSIYESKVSNLNDHNLSIKLKNYNEGYNFIAGRATIIREEEALLTTYFFDDFYARENSK